MTRTALLLALLLAPAAAFAECREVPGVGCFYRPDNADGTVLVYLRGHHPRWKGSVPKDRLIASSRQAFAKYALQAAADATGATVLVTGGSHVTVSAEVLGKLEPARVIVAAHSGAYASLPETLTALGGAHRVILLDLFYGEKTLAKTARLIRETAADCLGYFTDHTERRYRRLFAPNAPDCRIEHGRSHSGDVNACLANYVRGLACR